MPDIFVNETSKPEVHPKTHSHTPKIVSKTQLQKDKYGAYNHSPFSSFFLFPDKINFETQEPDEKIILLLRQHPIVNLKWILTTLLLAVFPSFLGILGVFEALPLNFSLVLTLCWYLIIMAYAMEGFLAWYFNVYFVTDRRIIDVDFHNIIYKQVSDAQLDKIQDLTYNMGGVVRTLFNYGNVFIQTAGEVNEFEFSAVPYPDRVAKIIQDLMTP